MKTLNFVLKNKSIFIITALSIVGFVLRSWNAIDTSFWVDELHTWAHVYDQDNLFGIGETKGPLHLIILYLYQAIFPHDPYILRLFSIICGTLAIPASYYLYKLIYQKNDGFIYPVLISFNSFTILYAQQYTCYSFFLLLGFLFFIYFIKLWKFNLLNHQTYNNPSKLNIFKLYIISTCLLYTHHFGHALVWPILIMALIYSLFKKLNYKPIATVIIFTFLSFIPWLKILLTNIVHPPSTIQWIEDRLLAWVWEDFYHAVFNSNYFNLGIKLILVMVFLKYIKKEVFITKFLFYVISLAISILILKSTLSYSVLVPRYFIAFTPILLLIVTRGIYFLKNSYLKFLFILALLYGNSNITHKPHFINYNENWEPAINYIIHNSRTKRINLYSQFHRASILGFYTDINNSTDTTFKLHYIENLKLTLSDRFPVCESESYLICRYSDWCHPKDNLKFFKEAVSLEAPIKFGVVTLRRIIFRCH